MYQVTVTWVRGQTRADSWASDDYEAAVSEALDWLNRQAGDPAQVSIVITGPTLVAPASAKG